MRSLVVILVLALLAAAAVAGGLYAERAVQQGIQTELTQLELVGQGFAGGEVIATVAVRNTARFGGRFDGLEGAVTVAGKEMAWELLDLEAGTELAGGDEATARIKVPMKLEDALGAGLSGITTGGIEFRFDGVLNVSALGLMPVAIPIHDRETVSLR